MGQRASYESDSKQQIELLTIPDFTTGVSKFTKTLLSTGLIKTIIAFQGIDITAIKKQCNLKDKMHSLTSHTVLAKYSE